MSEKKHYNIMTSSDGNLINNLTILLYSISRNLSNAEVDFYFLNRGISDEHKQLLKDYTDMLLNVTFHNILVSDAEKFDELSVCGGGWAGEAYFSFCAHQLLPENVDRVLYLDAGDTIIIDDIEKFYNCDFEDKSLIVHSTRYKTIDSINFCFEEDDLQDLTNGFPAIARGLFNSGSYMINLEKWRKDGRTIDDYLYLKNYLQGLFGTDKKDIYWGDQGLLAITFVGDIKYYDYDRIRNVWYMPYNFCLWYYNAHNEKPDYEPAVVHFAVNEKPWLIEYPITIERFYKSKPLYKISDLKIGQAEWYYLWHEYAIIVDRQLKELGY